MGGVKQSQREQRVTREKEGRRDPRETWGWGTEMKAGREGEYRH